MKALAIAACAALALSAAACSSTQLANISSTVKSGSALIASVNGAMPAACASVTQIAGDMGAAVAKTAAANPNNAKVQAVAAKVGSGLALTSTDCSTVAGLLGAY